MALTVNNVATAASTTPSSTFVVDGVTADVGDWLVICVAADNSYPPGAPSLLPEMSDTAGNTYVSRALNTNDPGAANEGVTVGIWTAPITTAITDGSITGNCSPDTPAKAIVVQRVTPSFGRTVGFSSVGSPTVGRNSNVSRTTPSIPEEYTLFFAVAVETLNAVTGDTDTINGAWGDIYTAVANTGTANTSQSIGAQYKTVTATGTQTWNPSWVSIADYIANHIVLFDVGDPDVAADATGVESVAGVGSVSVTVGMRPSPAGVSAIGHVGVVAVTFPAPVAASGVVATGQTGSLAVQIGAYARPSGVSATAVVGPVSAVPTSAIVEAYGVAAVSAIGYVLVWVEVDDSQAPNWQNVSDSQTPNWTPVVDAQTPGWVPVN